MDWGNKMDFYKRMHIVCNQIPSGKVATYGQLALLCGKPRNSRQVGYALRMGLAGEVPAHRIINSKGYLSGAGFFETSDTQKHLLEKEGVEVERTDSGYKVDLERFAWGTTEDEADAFYYLFIEEDNA